MRPLIDAEMKSCRVCKEDKPLKAFHLNKSCKQGVVGTCRSCTGERVSGWYITNRSRRQSVANEKNRSRKQKVVDHFGGKCHDCSGIFPNCVFQFHHLDPSQKDINPSGAMARNEETMWIELKKCVMLCANCHMIRHHYKGKEGVDETTH